MTKNAIISIIIAALGFTALISMYSQPSKPVQCVTYTQNVYDGAIYCVTKNGAHKVVN